MSEDLDVTTEQTAQALADGTAIVVDVREDDERAAGHIDGTLHIPLGQLSERAGEIPDDKPVYFQCLSGGRSTMAANAFRRAGYEAYSLAGGVLAWEARGLPFEGEVAAGQRAVAHPDCVEAGPACVQHWACGDAQVVCFAIGLSGHLLGYGATVPEGWRVCAPGVV